MIIDPRHFLPFDWSAVALLETRLGHPIAKVNRTERFEVAGVGSSDVDGDLLWAELFLFDHVGNAGDAPWSWTTIRTTRPGADSFERVLRAHAASAVAPIVEIPVTDESSLRQNSDRVDAVLDELDFHDSELVVGGSAIASRRAEWQDLGFAGTTLPDGHIVTVAGPIDFAEPLRF